MPTLCKVEGRQGDFRLIRHGRVNSRVQIVLDDTTVVPPNELVLTSMLRDVREVRSLPGYGRTAFREWFQEMVSGWGARPEWPQLLCNLLHQQYLKERDVDRAYQGERILHDRGLAKLDSEPSDERASVKSLYNSCLTQGDGCLTIGDDVFWILSYEVPNQFRDQSQRADLLGLSEEGGLVVFEAKLATNSYAPMCAMLEGLDYLAGLTCSSNFSRLQSDLQSLVTSRGRPKLFDKVEPKREARHSVVVLAEAGYFRESFERNRRGHGWRDLARVRPEDGEHVLWTCPRKVGARTRAFLSR